MSLLKGVGKFNSSRSRRNCTRLVGIKLSVGSRTRRVKKKVTTFPSDEARELQSELNAEVVDEDEGGDFVGGGIEDPGFSIPPTQPTHEMKKEKAAEQWSSLRGTLVVAFREQLVPPQSPTCSICGIEATVRCADCGVDVYFCEECGRRSHGERLIYHLLETWKVSIAVSGSYLYMHIAVCLFQWPF